MTMKKLIKNTTEQMSSILGGQCDEWIIILRDGDRGGVISHCKNELAFLGLLEKAEEHRVRVTKPIKGIGRR